MCEVIIIVAAVPEQFAEPDFHDAADELVQEFAIVRNHQDRAGIIPQIILKPKQCFEIEMVRRLVEHQQVGLLHEQARQMRAHHPAAAHLAGRTVEIGLAKTQAGEDFLRPGVELITAEFVEAVVGVVVEIGFTRMPRVPGEHLPAQPDELG